MRRADWLVVVVIIAAGLALAALYELTHDRPSPARPYDCIPTQLDHAGRGVGGTQPPRQTQ